MNEIHDIHHLAAAYALDALDEAERHAFEGHYPTCEVCRDDVAGFHVALSVIGSSTAVEPSAQLKGRVMHAVDRTRQQSPGTAVTSIDRARRFVPRAGALMLATAAAVAMFVAGVVVSTPSDTTFAAAMTSVMEHNDASLVTFDPHDSTGVVRIAWSPTAATAVLYAHDLPTAPDGRAYELWAINDDDAVPMGILDEADDGTIHAIVATPTLVTTWGVTIEPEQGVTSPTGAILFSTTV